MMSGDDGTPAGLPDEFAFIRRHFRRLASPGALDLTDDAAVFTPPAGRELVIAADAMVENVHFLPDDPPETIGRKVLRTNLSDLAAMNATALAWLLTISIPKARLHEAWFSAFCDGLEEDQRLFNLGLLGGDTTSTHGPLTLSVTILGHCAPGTALRRNGAKPGDGLWVTGTLGDAALGLRALRGEIQDPTGFLSERYHLPRPRIGLDLTGIARAGIDVSDGLVQDAGHLARESCVGLIIYADHLPLSPAARSTGPDALQAALNGGDDYELLLAIPPDREDALKAEAASKGIAITQIGQFCIGHDIRVITDDGKPITLTGHGWSHI